MLGGEPLTKFLCSVHVSLRERPQLTCRVVNKGRFAPVRSEIVPDQDLSDLHGIQGSALTQVVGHNPEIEAVGN